MYDRNLSKEEAEMQLYFSAMNIKNLINALHDYPELRGDPELNKIKSLVTEINNIISHQGGY